MTSFKYVNIEKNLTTAGLTSEHLPNVASIPGTTFLSLFAGHLHCNEKVVQLLFVSKLNWISFLLLLLLLLLLSSVVLIIESVKNQ